MWIITISLMVIKSQILKMIGSWAVRVDCYSREQGIVYGITLDFFLYQGNLQH